MLDRRPWLIAALLLAGCGTTSEPGSASEPQRVEDPAVDRIDRTDTPAVRPSEPPKPAPGPEPYTPDPEGFGDACSDDAGCGWDDPCAATRCIGAAHALQPNKCDESTPAPGTCSCVEGRCSLRPNEMPSPGPSCRLDSCGLDQGAGRCVAGSQLEANRYTRDVGPACACDRERLECRFEWVEAIACDDVAACWVSEGRPHHPIARPKSLRGRKFKPCRDGEVAPICKDGLCSLVAYSC